MVKKTDPGVLLHALQADHLVAGYTAADDLIADKQQGRSNGIQQEYFSSA
jgi:hypothetical protein